MKTFLIVFLNLLFSSSAWAEVQVAFIELRTASDELVQMEPGGRFGHTAISYRGKWLHAHPWRGVEWVEIGVIEKVGKVADILTLPGADEISEELVNAYLGRPFDRDFLWDDEKIYCSELIAKLLTLEPKPMYFDPALWPERYQRLNGLPGISPDEIYRRLRRRVSRN
jgi:hypothetical protein